MVGAVPTPTLPLDELFKALADPTRRAVVEQLGRGPQATSALAEGHGMALPSFIQHLDVLQAGGLVTSEKQGRVRTYRLVPAGLEPAEHWLDAQHRLWSTRLDQFDAYLTDLRGDPR